MQQIDYVHFDKDQDRNDLWQQYNCYNLICGIVNYEKAFHRSFRHNLIAFLFKIIIMSIVNNGGNKMFRLMLIYITCFCMFISSFCFAADSKIFDSKSKVKKLDQYLDIFYGEIPVFMNRDNDSLILGKNFKTFLAENGLKIYDEVPIIYPKDPYAAFLKFEKKAMDKGWMVDNGIFYCTKATQLFDVRSMSASDWRKTIFTWQTDIIEKKLYDHDSLSREKERAYRVHKLPEMSDEEYLHQIRYERICYLPDIYDSLPLDGSYRMCLSIIDKFKSQELFAWKRTYYLMFLVGNDNIIYGFGLLDWPTKYGSPFKRMKKIGFYIPGIFGTFPPNAGY